MNSYRYRVTLEKIAGQKGEVVVGEQLSFEALNHDDIFPIVERMRGRGDLDADTAAALAVGLKLFSEVVLQNRQREPFAGVRPALSAFIGNIKQGVGAKPAESQE